jgi:hypothetical protein
MKSLVELYRTSLLEHTYDIDVDVDFIYTQAGYAEFVDSFRNGNIEACKTGKFKDVGRGMPCKLKTFSSSKLTSVECMRANKINPIKIYTYIGNNTLSHYNPKNKEISINISARVVEILFNSGPYAIERITGSKRIRLYNEISEARIKGTIYHELSHWLNDSLHNRHLNNLLNPTQEPTNQHNKPHDIKLGFPNVNLTHFEIDAQIHNIKELRRHYSIEEWNTLTWPDIFNLLPPLSAVYDNIKDSKYKEYWLRKLSSRLNREGLFGKGLQDLDFTY